jgi:hypothetical protein
MTTNTPGKQGTPMNTMRIQGKESCGVRASGTIAFETRYPRVKTAWWELPPLCFVRTQATTLPMGLPVLTSFCRIRTLHGLQKSKISPELMQQDPIVASLEVYDTGGKEIFGAIDEGYHRHDTRG